MLLPFYDVFDEQRYFAPATQQEVVKIGNEVVALTICEDAWNDKGYWKQRLYTVDPVEEQVRQRRDADSEHLVLTLLAGEAGAARGRCSAAAARHHRLPILMVNQAGGNDSLIFDGT